jgi:hypothetical protein
VNIKQPGGIVGVDREALRRRTTIGSLTRIVNDASGQRSPDRRVAHPIP